MNKKIKCKKNSKLKIAYLNKSLILKNFQNQMKKYLIQTNHGVSWIKQLKSKNYHYLLKITKF